MIQTLLFGKLHLIQLSSRSRTFFLACHNAASCSFFCFFYCKYLLLKKSYCKKYFLKSRRATWPRGVKSTGDHEQNPGIDQGHRTRLIPNFLIPQNTHHRFACWAPQGTRGLAPPRERVLLRSVWVYICSVCYPD